MLSTEKRTEYFNAVILHLANPENRIKEFRYDDLAELLGIPKEYKSYVLDALWSSRGYINSEPAIKNPLISIAKPGLEYADQIEQKHFEANGLPIFATIVDMDINDTCELIFKKHKATPSYSVIWTKETFKPNPPRNLYEAKELMELKQIIVKSSHSNIKTILVDEYHNAESYGEALDISKKLTAQNGGSNNYHYGSGDIHFSSNQTNVRGNTNAIGNTHSSFDKSFNSGDSNKAETKKWYQKWVDEFIKNTTQYVITALFAFLVGLVSGKGCTQDSIQEKSPKTNSTGEQRLSPNKGITLLGNIREWHPRPLPNFFQ